MGLNMEIWCVPKGWSHPINENGYIPLYGQDYDLVARRWMRNMSIWKGYKSQADPFYYWEFTPPPKREHYQPFESGNLGCYQIYDDKGVGLPQSPVFPDLVAMKKWLIEGSHYSVEFAEAFSRYGYPRRSSVKDGTGYFHITNERWLRTTYSTEFIINGFRCWADLYKVPIAEGLNGSRVISLRVRNPTAEPTSPARYSFPEEMGGQEKPRFLDSLVILLDNLYQTPEDEMIPKCAWVMAQTQD